MPKCSRCGKIMWNYTPAQLSAGLCKKCVEIREKENIRNAQIRVNNYQRFLSREARPGNQRIFDAFVSKYPDAHITSVAVIDTDNKLLFYLDGKPEYYVTLNSLTGSIDLVSYQEVLSQRSAAEKEKAALAAAKKMEDERAKSAGCSIFFSVVGVLYGLFCMLFNPVGGVIGIFCSLVVLAGGISKSRFAVIFGGTLSLGAAVIGFPSTILFVLFGIFYIVLGTDI